MVAAVAVSGAIAVGTTAMSNKAAGKAAGKAADASVEGTRLTVEEQRRQYDTTREDWRPYREVGEGALGLLADIYGIQRPQEQKTWLSESDMRNALAQELGYAKPPSGGGGVIGAAIAKGLNARQQAEIDKLLPERMAAQQAEREAWEASQAARGPVDRTAGFVQSPGYQFRLDEGNRAIQNSLAAQGRVFSGGAVKAATEFSQGVASDEWNRYLSGIQSLAGVGVTGTQQTAAAGAQSAGAISQAHMAGAAQRGSAYLAQGQAQSNAWQGVNNAVQGSISNYMLMDYLKSR